MLAELREKEIEYKTFPKGRYINFRYKKQLFMSMGPLKKSFYAEILMPDDSWTKRKIFNRDEWNTVYREYIQKYVEYRDERLKGK